MSYFLVKRLLEWEDVHFPQWRTERLLCVSLCKKDKMWLGPFLPLRRPNAAAFPAPSLCLLTREGIVYYTELSASSRTHPAPSKGYSFSCRPLTSAGLWCRCERKGIVPCCRERTSGPSPELVVYWEGGGVAAAAAAWGRRGFSYDDAGTLQGLFLKLLKCATPFRYCNLQLQRHNQNKQRPWEAAAGEGALCSSLSRLLCPNEIWIMGEYWEDAVLSGWVIVWLGRSREGWVGGCVWAGGGGWSKGWSPLKWLGCTWKRGLTEVVSRPSATQPVFIKVSTRGFISE